MTGPDSGAASATGDLFEAIRASDTARVRGLLDADPTLVAATGPDGASAALTALYHRQTAMADELAARSGPLPVFEAAAFDDTGRPATLLRDDPQVVAAWSADGWQPLHLAAFFGRAAAARMLLDADAPVGEPSRNAMTVHPLHAAAAGGHAELLWLLIAADADVNATQAAGCTALHSAAANGDAEAVRALLAAGADPQRADDQGHRPAELASSEPVRALLAAARPGGAAGVDVS
jgi:ankyrin repeat protein